MRKSCAVILLFSLSQCCAMDKKKNKRKIVLRKVVTENFSDFSSGEREILSSYKKLKSMLKVNNFTIGKEQYKSKKTSISSENSSGQSLSLEDILGQYNITPNLLAKILSKATHEDVDVQNESRKMFKDMQKNNPEGYAEMSHAACKNLHKKIVKDKGKKEYEQYKNDNQNDGEIGFQQLAMQKNIEYLNAKYEIEKKRANDNQLRNQRKRDADCSRFSSNLDYVKKNAVPLVNLCTIIVGMLWQNYGETTGNIPGNGTGNGTG